MSGDTILRGNEGANNGTELLSENGNGKRKKAKTKQVIYVTDTSVHIADPAVVRGFKENDVCTPTVVIEELNNHKTHKDENKAFKARNALKEIQAIVGNDAFHETPAQIPNGGKYMALTDYSYELVGNNVHLSSNDNFILRAALGLQKKNPDKQVVLVSLDTGLRVAAQAYGLRAESYRNISVDLSTIREGMITQSTTTKEIQYLLKQGEIPVGEKYRGVLANEFVFIKNHQDQGLWHADAHAHLLRHVPSQRILGFEARDPMQQAAMHLGLSSIPCVVFRGEMGTGKTLIAVLCALQLVKEGKYDKIVIFRSLSTLGGKDIGFLPGDVKEKIDPYAQAILDEFHNVRDQLKKKNSNLVPKIEDIINTKIQIDTVSLVQGKNLRKSIILVDDAQNFDRTETKGYVSRLSDDSKIIITGDEKQVADTRFLNENTTGFVHLLRKMSGHPTFGHVTLKEVYRSELVKALVERWDK